MFSLRILLAALVLVLSVGFGYYAFAYRPQEIKRECLALATYSSPGVDTKMYGRIGEGRKINEEIYYRCLGK